MVVKNEAEKKNIRKILDSNYSHIQITKSMIRKLIYLYIRIKTKIPTIIMGDTGVGKTILVKLLSTVMASEITTIDVHPGIT